MIITRDRAKNYLSKNSEKLLARTNIDKVLVADTNLCGKKYEMQGKGRIQS